RWRQPGPLVLCWILNAAVREASRCSAMPSRRRSHRTPWGHSIKGRCMPSKRDVLDQLKRDELLDALDQAGLEVRDRRVRDELIDALASSRKVPLAEVLGRLPRTRLKEICRAFGLDDSGREKAPLVERLAGLGRSSEPGASSGATVPQRHPAGSL